MTNECPQTLAAAQARIAELEQQLQLSDAGVSRMAERCLELEQQLLVYQTELAKLGTDNEPVTMILPQLFYDSGNGFSPRECLTVTEESYNELTHEVSATFVLPADARALRLDPGELACCVTDLAISDERLRYSVANGLQLREGTFLFMDIDPNFRVESLVGFAAGMKFAVNYHYYPLGRFLHEQPGKSLLQTLNVLREQKDSQAQEAAAVLESSRREVAQLRRELEQQRTVYEAALQDLQQSHSWRVTAPLRAVVRLLHRGR